MCSASKAIAAPSKAFQSTLRKLAAFHKIENFSFSGLNILILVVPPAAQGMVLTPRANRGKTDFVLMREAAGLCIFL